MAKEIYLYSGINDYTASEFIQSLEDNKDEVIGRINSPGGSVFAFWGMAAKMIEHGNVTLKVDGGAFSAAAFILLYANKVEALDVSTFMFHRADMYVDTPEDQAFLDKVNADLKAKMIKKVDAAKLKELKGITIEQLFDPNKRIDLFLTAKEMKQLGLVSKVTKMDPTKASAFSNMFKMAAKYQEEQNQNINKNDKKTEMDLNKLKSEHPALYNEVLALGASKEHDRVSAWMEFIGIDSEAVKKGIEDKAELNQKAMAGFTMKAINAASLKNLEGVNSDKIETGEDTNTDDKSTQDEKDTKAFWDNAKALAKTQVN